jgi:hypothetical protein
MSRRILAGGGALLLVASLPALPATANAAPTIDPLKPCYVTADTVQGHQSEGVEIRATGFTPNSTVDLFLDGVAQPDGADLQVGQTGELVLAQPFPAPFVESGSQSFTITLTEDGNPANTVSATSKSTALGVTVTPRQARPSQRIRFRGLGFTQRKPVFAHYIFRGKVRKTVRMARRPSVCGGFTAHRPQIPIKDPHVGTWTIQFDQSKRFVNPARTPIVFVRLAIRITLVRQ